MDVCGICNGNQSTCQDCSGIPNGNKVTDHCGKCLLKSDPKLNNCTKFIDIPLCWAIENGLEVKTIGLAEFDGSRCQFMRHSTE